MGDGELLQSAQLVQTDPETGESGVTLAGVMLFGHDEQILRVCPAHRTDLLVRKVELDRYDDRDLVITNLIDSYDRIMAFVRKHLPDPFYLEGIERRSLREHIFREVASNLLIHRDYTSGATSRLVIEYGRVVTDNPSRPYGFGALDLETFIPYQKNPTLSAFFRQIERADELGSGMRKMMLYGRKYGGKDPVLIEGDTFRMIISVPEFNENPARIATILSDDPTAGFVSEPSSQEHREEEAVHVATNAASQAASHDVSRSTSNAAYSATSHATSHAERSVSPLPTAQSDPNKSTLPVALPPPDTTHQITPKIIDLLRALDGDMSCTDLMDALSLEDWDHFRADYLDPALAVSLIDGIQPGSAPHPTQRYRLTVIGRLLLREF